MKEYLSVLFLLLLVACNYDCREAKRNNVFWKWRSGEIPTDTLRIPDVFNFQEGGFRLDDQCQISRENIVIGKILFGQRRYWTNDEAITVHYNNGAEVEYVSK